MGERAAARERRRDEEFESFVAGAAGRLLHAAVLLTAEPAAVAPRAQRLLLAALARTYAHWDRLRGDDPYEHTRQELATRFARTAWRHHRPSWHRPGRAGGGAPSAPAGGVLERLPPQERLVLVLRLYEGIADEQVAAALGLPAERVRTLCGHATATLRSAPREPAPRLPRAAAP
ncbi:sigma factor-like helix-turn-helix DNA-binding protein [Streptomyces sp. NBC_00388]|uniref:sigma factor-like helix-turn-helix DNA-binding protein n=1 Tax=Streptomyces sp. NBC_00388 TaxID=2975735 RepID=UPI002E231451